MAPCFQHSRHRHLYSHTGLPAFVLIQVSPSDIREFAHASMAHSRLPSGTFIVKTGLPENMKNTMGNNEERPENKKKKREDGLPFGAGIVFGVVITAVVLTVFFAVFYSKTTAEAADDALASEKIEEIMELVEKYYVGEIDEDALEDGIASGLVEALGDKYASYYSEEDFATYTENMAGSYAGIGVAIVTDEDGNVVVQTVYEGSTAEAAGIQVGDIICGVDGVTEFETSDDLVAAVRGEAGTTVEIMINRDGEEITLTVERAEVEMETVSYEMLDGNIGYIQLIKFNTASVSQFEEALEDLTEQGMESLILDLRDNTGGDYDAVVSISDMILPEGVIMTVKDNSGNIITENSDDEHQVTVPMVVLINGNTASASEVLTGAIQDYGMATIIGTQSYGKGVVQSIFRLSDDSGVKFTTKYYYTPSGRSIDGVGITPDIVVELDESVYDDGVLDEDEDTQLKTAIDVLTGEYDASEN